MSHTYFKLYYHLIWSTWERHPIIRNEFRHDFYKYLSGGIKGEGGYAIEIGGVSDHVHLLVEIPPRLAIAQVVRNIKISSAKWISRNFAKHGDHTWQEGYGIFSVSESTRAQVASYIQNQEQHHQKYSFQEEFLTLLRRHNVKFNEEYLWK